MLTPGQHQILIAELISNLLFNKMHNTLNQNDRDLLDRWLREQDEVTRQFLEEACDWEQIERDLNLFAKFDIEAAWLEVQQRMDE
jgi:hypothetical protein